MSDDTQRRARLALARLSEPGDLVIARRLQQDEPDKVVADIRQGRISELRGYQPRLSDVDPDADLVGAASLGAHVLIPGEPGWPDQLDALEAPPHCLWVLGTPDLSGLCERAVAIVGARACTAYGLDVAHDLAGGLAQRGFTIISGGAFGIDAAAHRAALSQDGVTVAVMARGLDRFYPASNTALLRQVRHAGAVISELPPGWAPLRHRFLARNRLIAALGPGVVVVEAGLRSGSRNTARWARELGRPVGAVPGPVTSMASAGCHEEIRQGLAALVTDAAEVAELVGRIGQDLADPKHGPIAALDLLGPDAGVVHAAMPLRTTTTDERLARLTALSDQRVRAALGELTMEGLAVRTDDGWRRRHLPGSG